MGEDSSTRRDGRLITARGLYAARGARDSRTRLHRPVYYPLMLRRPVIGIAALAALLLPHPAGAHAHRASTPPDSLGSAPDVWQASAGDRADRWNLLLGEARTDTLAATPPCVLSAAEAALEDDHWVIQPHDQSRLGFTTDWKAIHNVVFHLFAGSAVARCFVSVAPLEAGHSVIRLQGGIASRHALAESPMLPLALHAYRNALRKWALEVRESLERLPQSTP